MKSDSPESWPTVDDLHSLGDAEFLNLLADREIILRVQDGKLRVSAPPGVVDDTLKAELLRRKTTLREHLSNASAKDLETAAPLSYAQERLWLLERFQPGNFAYNIPETFEVNAPVNPMHMQRAIDVVVQRHTVLRTSLHEDKAGSAQQWIHAEVAAPLQFIDYGTVAAEERESRLQEQLRDLAREPFQLSQAPLVRFYLFRLGEARHVVFINIHHIVADRWSMRILRQELLAAYQAYVSGVEPLFKPLPMQYADHARQERFPDRTDAQRLEQQLQYWQKQLSDLSEPAHLPFRLIPAQLKPFEGAICLLALEADHSVKLRAFARAQGVSLYMLILATYAALLYRFTGARDQCIGSPVTERTGRDTEALIGMFVNTLVMRCSVSAGLPFTDLLKSVRGIVLDAHQNREVPLQRILAALHPDSDRAGQSPFQTVLGFDAYMGDATEGSHVPFDPGFAKFDLTLQMYEERDRIGGWFEYRSDLFSRADIEKFAKSFVLLLRSAVTHPEQQISKLQILSAEEQARLLRGKNATAMRFPDRTIHSLFEDQAALSPDATALIDGTERISYRELNRQANRIAHGIISLDLGPESIVGVHLQRSPRMIAALLGILKAGCAYLPLDPKYPADRLRVMIEDSGCTVVLSTAGEQFGQARTISPAFSEVSGTDLDRDPHTSATPRNLAYVIFTSGSTGRPKGVAIEHHSAVSFLQHASNTFPDAVMQGTLAATSISFDLSVFEIFLPLITGHTIILADDVLHFPVLPAAHEVTLVATVPSAAAALLATAKIPDNVRTIVLGGELLSTRLVDRLYTETNVSNVIDIYGPTETTTYSVWNRREQGRQPTIGKPIGNTRIYLLDAALELVPEGVPGEVFIAGEGVARGYIGRPDLTIEKFISLAHLGETSRAYRTGDLCRWRPDGALEYLGRIDSQVKVRGFRIELAEVEGALLAHPDIRDVAVTAQTDGDAGATLLAAVLLAESSSLDIPALIEHQSRTLPPHMVARKIIALDEFPRTASGKIDRRKLASLDLPEPVLDLSSAPLDPLEKTLVEIWQSGFQGRHVDVDDDFFQLGGHSLLALRIFSEIEAQLGYRMMLSVLFQAPTIRKLADYIRLQRPAS